jgi:hypothetical protein
MGRLMSAQVGLLARAQGQYMDFTLVLGCCLCHERRVAGDYGACLCCTSGGCRTVVFQKGGLVLPEASFPCSLMHSWAVSVTLRQQCNAFAWQLTVCLDSVGQAPLMAPRVGPAQQNSEAPLSMPRDSVDALTVGK